MKILFDARVHLNYFSGISRYIICLLEAYASEYPQDELMVLLNPTILSDNNIYKKLGGYSNVKFKTVDAGHMGPKNYLIMGRIIKRLAPDVYHYPHLDAPIFTGDIPIVATVHDSNSNKDVKKFDDKFGLKSIYFKKALGSTLKHASKVIFVSDSIKKEILNTYKLDEQNQKFIRIHNGFEPSFNQIDKAEQTSILAKLGITTPYIFFVGQIREHKNIHRSVEAFKAFQVEHPQYKLVIVGHNYLQLELNGDHIKHFDKVSNTELKVLYAGCSVFLFPSLFEGFGFPILEAFSFGKPVITSNYGATAEISGGQAILVDPTSVSSISTGITKAIQADHKNEERIKHTTQFSWKENAKALRKIYLEVTDQTS